MNLPCSLWESWIWKRKRHWQKMVWEGEGERIRSGWMNEESGEEREWRVDHREWRTWKSGL